jgi:lariat debranching enzyme
VAPNIFYLGYAGVVNFGGLRIGGLSGIFKSGDYRKGHFESPPFDDRTMRSFYHVREFEVFQLSQLAEPVDMMISHDWPRGIAKFGDVNWLFRKKAFLKDEIQDNSLGSIPGEHLLHHIRPSYWFSAHLHVKYPAVVKHPAEGRPEGPRDVTHPKTTKFLALDKLVVKQTRDFLQVIDFPDKPIDPANPPKIAYDPEWLAVVRLTQHLRSSKRQACRLPAPQGPVRWSFEPTSAEKEQVKVLLRAGTPNANVAVGEAAEAAMGEAAAAGDADAVFPWSVPTL